MIFARKYFELVTIYLTPSIDHKGRPTKISTTVHWVSTDKKTWIPVRDTFPPYFQIEDIANHLRLLHSLTEKRTVNVTKHKRA